MPHKLLAKSCSLAAASERQALRIVGTFSAFLLCRLLLNTFSVLHVFTVDAYSSSEEEPTKCVNSVTLSDVSSSMVE